MGDSRVSDLLRRLLTMQFSPKEHVPFALNNLTYKSDNRMFQELCNYIHDTFIVGWHSAKWSNYKLTIKTNNDTHSHM